MRAGVIGLGVGERHVVAYNEIPGCSVTDICDVDPAKVSEVARRQGVGRTHTDWRRLVESPDIDVVSVCSYDDAHAEQVVAALRAGKHVMVEKPVVLHRREAEQVLRAQQDSGKRLSSNLILRQSPRFKRIKEMVGNGEFGDIAYLEGDYLHDILWKITNGWRGKMDFYCTVFGGGIHLIDLMRWIIGQDVTQVSAMGNDIFTRGTAYRWPDSIVALLRYQSGAVGKTATLYGPRRPKMHTLNIFGTKLSFENAQPFGRLFSSDDPAEMMDVHEAYPGMEKGDHLPGFIHALRSGTEPPVTEIEVFRVMDVCFAIWESVKSGKPVTVEYLI